MVSSRLFGSKIRVALLFALVVVAAVGGAFTLGVIGKPSLEGIENRFGGVNETTTVVESELVVSNPNPVGADLQNLTAEYAIGMNGIEMARGSKHGVSVGTGRSRIPLTTRLSNERIPVWWVSHVQNDERTNVTIHATVHSGTLGQDLQAPPVSRSVETDLISQFNSTEPRPVNASAPLVSDPVLYVNETSARWGTVNRSVTPIDLTFEVYNPKSYPLGVTELGYEITMNDVPVGAGSSEGPAAIEPRTTETIRTTTHIDNDKLDEWWVTHLQRNQTTDLRIEFYAVLDLGGETVRVPLDQLTYTRTIETDIFGNGARGDEGGADESTPTSGTPTATDEQTTTRPATTTGERSPTEQPSSTTTDDGLLDGLTGETTTTSTPATTPTTSAHTTSEQTTGNETTTDDELF
jgi:LEA14-like dessication related protein